MAYFRPMRLFPLKLAARLAAGLFASAGLASCAVGPDYQKPNLAVPAQWSGGPKAANAAAAGQQGRDQSAALAGWWKNLHDPRLNQLVNAAIAQNLDVASAKARIRQARATIYQTAGALLPGADYGGSYNRRRTAGMDPRDAFNGNFDASWELDIFGGNKRSIEAAQAGFAAAQEDLRNVMVTLIGDVAANYVEIRRLQAQLAMMTDMARSQRSTANLVKKQLQAGQASALDANNANGQAADMEASLPVYRGQIAVAQHRLAVLLGQPPAAIISLTEPAGVKAGGIPVPPARLPATIPADILLSRPDVRAAERRLAQATAIIGQREAQLYPGISLTGSIATNTVNFSDFAKYSTIGWAFGPSLTVPLFHGGQLLANVYVAKALRDQNFIAYRQAVLTALQDVEDALASLKNDRLAAQKKTEAAQSYRASLNLARGLYASGNTSFLELLTAERSASSAGSGAIDARANMAKDYISLMKALGGGWDGAVSYGRREIDDTHTAPHFVKLPNIADLSPDTAQIKRAAPAGNEPEAAAAEKNAAAKAAVKDGTPAFPAAPKK